MSAPTRSGNASKRMQVAKRASLISHNEDNSSNAAIPLTKNALRKLPPELRQKIFYFSEVSTKTLAAFIGDKVIYYEALKVYLDTTRFTIPYHDYRYFRFSTYSLSQKTINSIKKVRVVVEMLEMPGEYLMSHEKDAAAISGWNGWQYTTPPMSELVDLGIADVRLKFLNYRCRVEYVYEFAGETTERIPDYVIVCRARDCIAAFSGTSHGLRIFGCEFQRAPDYSNYALYSEEAIDALNKAFGVAAKLASVDTGVGPVVYFWENQEGRLLSWYENAEIPNNCASYAVLERSPYFLKP